MLTTAALALFSLLPLLGRTGAAVCTTETPKADGCDFRLNADLPKKTEPLYLVRGSGGTLALALPKMVGDYGAISLQKGETLTLGCPGAENLVANSTCPRGSQSCTGSCAGNASISLSDATVYIGSLDCVHRASPGLKVLGATCGPGTAVLLELGFQLGDAWYGLITVCHDIDACSTYFSSHTLHGSSLKGKVTGVERPDFKRGGDQFFAGFNPDDSYGLDNELRVVEAAVGAEAAKDYLLPKKELFMARGHFAPNGDFLFAAWEHASFFYVNVAPQWQSINGGHWNEVEANVRTLAIQKGAEFRVTTGPYGVMALNSKDLYLEDGRVPVPELYWKIVHDPRDDSCIVLISTNNPFLAGPPVTLCPDVCAAAGWPLLQSDMTKGYVYCCEYAPFARAVPYAPSYPCENLLAFRE